MARSDPRKPLSDATKAKIGAANRGKKHTAAFCAAMSARRKGVSYGPCTPERAAAISAANRGKKRTAAVRAANSAARMGHVPSAEARAKNGATHRGMKRPPFSAEYRAKIGAAQLGRTHSLETRRKHSESTALAWEEGRHVVHKLFRYTTLARALHAHLASTGLTLELEVRFGRYTVDLYDRDNHVAYEADGKYWHNKTEANRPGYHANRDTYLSQRFGITVVHFDDVAIREMSRKLVA